MLLPLVLLSYTHARTSTHTHLVHEAENLCQDDDALASADGHLVEDACFLQHCRLFQVHKWVVIPFTCPKKKPKQA